MLTLADGTILMGYAIVNTEHPRLGKGAFLVRDSGTDQGYPSSVQLDDGTIVTV